MSSAEKQSQQEKASPLLSRLYRWFFAACIVVGMAATLVSVIANPGYYRSGNGEITAFIAAFAASSAVMGQTHVISMVLVAYLLPLGLLAMAWLALRRSPWWASVAALVVLVGLLPLASFAGEDSLSYDIAHMGSNPLLLTMAMQFDHDGVMNYYKAMFILGSILGSDSGWDRALASEGSSHLGRHPHYYQSPYRVSLPFHPVAIWDHCPAS